MRWTVITNCDSFFITRCDTVYYKLRQVLQFVMDLLQIAMIITNCDSTKRKELANFWRKMYFKNKLKYSKRSDHVTKWSRNDCLLDVKHIVRENITFQHCRVDERSTSTTHGLVSRLLPSCWLYCPLNFMPDVNCMVILKCSARPKPQICWMKSRHSNKKLNLAIITWLMPS